MIEGGSVYRRGKRWTGQLLSQLGSASRGGKGLRRNPIRFDFPSPLVPWKENVLQIDASIKLGVDLSMLCFIREQVSFSLLIVNYEDFFRVNQDLVESVYMTIVDNFYYKIFLIFRMEIIMIFKLIV